MEKKYQIFISSTYDDLKEERKKVQDAILSMYHFPIGMEMFSATDVEQWEIIKETIDSPDYYVLIIGYRYGSEIETGEDAGISYTQKEYQYAIKQGIPVLAFLADEKKVAVLPEKMERDNEKKEKLEEFKNEVMKGRAVEWWESGDDLARKVMNALNKQMKCGKRPGWVRGLNEDMGIYSEDEKKHIFVEFFRDLFFPTVKDDVKIKELGNIQFERLIDKTKKKQYLVNYQKEVNITLENDYIYVESTWIQEFRNVIGEEYIYTLSPWLLPGLELDSYTYSEIQHNRKNICVDEFIILNPPRLAPNSKYYIKYDIKIPFDKQEKQLIKIKSSYKTNYAEFFHTYTFGMYCETFNLSARIIDNRETKNDSYILRWQIFPDADLKRDVSANMITQAPDYILFTNMKWMSPGTGYIITLNHISKKL